MVFRPIARGADVYAYLAGIMALAEIGRRCGVFDWIAGALLQQSRDSRARLFTLMFALGTLVTALLSNDTTAVVLTPAIAAALVRTHAKPLPYLYACAFVANAASFVFPFSNPANLVVFDSHLPSLAPWLSSFGLSSAAAVVCTYAALRLLYRRDLSGTLDARGASGSAHPARSRAALMMLLATVALVIGAALHADLGITALASACVAAIVVAMRDRSVLAFVVRHISWRVIALVAVLFVIVSALDRAGALGLLRGLLAHASPLAAGIIIAVLDNALNNLPVALATGTALVGAHVSTAMRSASVVAVDLGPNLSVSGSLATLLWIIALKRDGIHVTFWQFLAVGAVVTAPALVAALLLAR